MKRIFITISFFIATFSFYVHASHAELLFNKVYVDCIDKWVAFPMSGDSTYLYGFVYFDEAQGLVFDSEGRFKVLANGNFESAGKAKKDHHVKIPLSIGEAKIAHIPANRLGNLAIESFPDWLEQYKSHTASLQYLYAKGALYSDWGKCEEAAFYFNEVHKLDPSYEDVGSRLAISYNCLEQYDKAIEVSKQTLRANHNDTDTHRELIFALVNSQQLKQAAKSCKTALKCCTNQSYNAVNSYRVLFQFYVMKDEKNFNYWLEETRKWLPYAEEDADMMKRHALVMEHSFATK